jgi:HAD superfamily hydrolase (TIGR01509 family)
MITTILFDADGVLINGKSFSTQLEKDFGISPELTTSFFVNEFSSCLIGTTDLKEKIEPYLKRWGWKGSVNDLLNYWFEVEHSIDKELINYIQYLRSKGIKCIVETNQEKYRAEYMLNKMGFKETFDEVIASAHLGAKKPDQSFFELILRKMNNTKKDDVLFWDDAISNIKAAKSFGIHAEHYTSFKDFKEKMSIYLNEYRFE